MTDDPSLAAAGDARVLLIEDDEGDAFLVGELLKEVGSSIELIWARSMAEAREAVAAQPDIDCVLIDLGLPDAHGLEAVRTTLDVVAGTAVIVLTGLAEESSGTEALAAGAQDYLVKGQVDGHLLTRSIRYAMQRRRADEQLRRFYASELRAAENARLEWGLLPHPIVNDPRLTVHTRYRAGRDGVLGGDFFDVVETDDRRLHVLVGDVSGHGADEAAVGVALRIAWRTLVLAGTEAAELLPILADVLVRERRFDEVFATLCCVVVSPDRRTAQLFLAGHPAPLLLGATPRQLPDDLVGPAIAMFHGVTWGSRTLSLGDSWRLMLFSDGLVEGRVGTGAERLGVDGLVEIARDFTSYTDTATLIDHLIGSARALNGSDLADDVAVLVVECAACP